MVFANDDAFEMATHAFVKVLGILMCIYDIISQQYKPSNKVTRITGHHYLMRVLCG